MRGLFKTFQRFIKDYSRNESGAIAVEFAMIAMGFVVVLISVVESGRMMWTLNALNYAVEEGSRYASIHDSAPSSEVQKVITDYLNEYYVDENAVSVTVREVSSGGLDFVEIETSYNYSPLGGTVLPITDSSFTFNIDARRPVLNGGG